MPATAAKSRPWEKGQPTATAPASAPKLAAVPEKPAGPVLKIEKPKTIKAHLADLYDMTAAQLIDQLAHEQAEIARVKNAKDREEEIKKLLKPLGAGAHNGSKCFAEITVTATKTLDADAVKAILPEGKEDDFYKHGTQTKIVIKPLV